MCFVPASSLAFYGSRFVDFIEILTALSDNHNMGTAPKDYDVDWETQFTRDKLQTAIPSRLQELYDTILSCKSKGTAEPWFADLVVKILLSVNRVCGDLLKTIDQDALSGAAWNSRNLLELWVWLKYCATSQENARRFYEDALRDMQGLTDALSKLHALQGILNEFEASARVKIAGVRDKLGLDSLDSDYTHVAEAAKAVGLGDFFVSNNKLLSKFAHPTGGPCAGNYAPVGNSSKPASHADHFWTFLCWPMRNRIGRNRTRHSY
jgi:hypothetical protein